MKSRVLFFSIILFCFILMPVAEAQPPNKDKQPHLQSLPVGAKTRWEVSGPEEIITPVIFDPATVADRLPRGLRFITLEETAVQVPPARQYLQLHPEHAKWGVSFLEIVRQTRFSIDGREPRWPADGAAAVWMARVKWSEPQPLETPGDLVLALDLWMPDSKYVAYMRKKGHYATYGKVKLSVSDSGRWNGTIEVAGLGVSAACTTTGEARSLGPGTQAFYPPGQKMDHFVFVSFAGHQERACEGSWSFTGTHPLAKAVTVGQPIFQFGYDMVGGAYNREVKKTIPSASVNARRFSEDQFLELEQGWMDALAKKDMAKLETILAPEFTIVGAVSTDDDMVRARATWLKNAARHPWPRHEVKIIKVQKLDRLAVVHCVLTAEYPPQSITPKGGLMTFLVTDTWIKRGGRWQVLSRHANLLVQKD